MMTMNSGSVLSVAPDHTAVFLAPLVVPVVVWVFFFVANRLAESGVPLAAQFLAGYEESPPLARIVAALLLLAGVSHLLLVPTHLKGDSTLALLFELNGLAFVLVAAAVFVWAPWRLAAGLLTLATLVSYLDYLIAGRESLDEVGILCYLLELVILALVWIPDYNGAKAQPDSARSDRQERATG
jgi:hypothetical protein